MALTARQLNRATLERQLLLERQRCEVVDAVRAVGALQAQSAASPYLALWNRVRDFDPTDLDRAFADRRIVKATLMRITLHAVASEDFPAFKRAMSHSLRRSALGAPRFTVAGLSSQEADGLVPQLVEFAAQPRSNQELEAEIARRTGVEGRAVWWALRRFVPMVHAPTGGPWSFNDRPAYIAAGIQPFDGGEQDALAHLVRRYLRAFGPASIQDITQFTMIPQPPVRAALEVLRDDLETHDGPDGKTLYDIRGGALPAEETPVPPRLLAMWDNVLLAYRDRGRVVPEPYRKFVLRTNGDTLPTILVDGYVAGVWRAAPEQPSSIEVTAFHALDDRTWAGLEAEARSLIAFLADRQPNVYSRYGRWWKTLPSAEVRLLAA